MIKIDRPPGLILRALFEGDQPEIVSIVHCARLFLAEFDRARPLHNFFRHDVAAFVCLQQKERVIGMHSSAIAKPANAAVLE